MKRYFLTILMIMALIAISGVANAMTLPETHAGGYYSFKEHGLNHAETFDIMKIKDVVAIEGGYAGDLSESDHKIVAAISLDIKQLKLSNYVTFPILNLIELRPAIFAGLGSINLQDMSGSKFDWGIGASFITLKF